MARASFARQLLVAARELSASVVGLVSRPEACVYVRQVVFFNFIAAATACIKQGSGLMCHRLHQAGHEPHVDHVSNLCRASSRLMLA